MAPLHINWQKSPYRVMIGTGGIGSGLFFALDGNQTLGREESRAGRFLNRRDYCKLHIISHYVKVLLGPDFQTTLIGKVGDDPAGHSLLDEMQSTGLDMRYVQVSPQDQTMFSVCFIYPDGSGGNLTSEDSACSKVDATDILAAEPEFTRFQGRGVALAAPEVPLEARRELLSLATRYHFFRVGSFVSAEILSALEMGLLEMLDLLALNIDEAAALTRIDIEHKQSQEVVEVAVGQLSKDYPRLMLSLTAGKNGSWAWDGAALIHKPAYPVRVISTAGAGDAHLAGMIVGQVAGLSLAQSQELAGLVASLSVTSPHTIAREVERTALFQFAQTGDLPLDKAVIRLIED